MLNELAVLKHRSVSMLLAARSVSLLGNAIAPIALAFTVLELPGGTPSMLGLVLAARLLSQVTFVLFGGVIADRLPKLRVMISADLGAGIVQAVAALLVVIGQATPLLLAVLAAFSGAATALFEPASRSVMPQLVKDESLQSANALVKLSMRGGAILGAALGGVLVTLIGTGATLFVDAGTFFVSALLLCAVRIPGDATPSPSQPDLVGQLRDGWREFTSHQWVWVMVSQLALVNVLLAAGFYVLGPVVADRSLGGASAWSVILTAQAIGFVLGSAVAIKIRPRRPVRVAALLTTGFPLPLFLLAQEAPVAAIAAVTFAAAVCIDVYEVTLDTALQKHMPPEALSRVMSYEALGSFAFVPLGLAVAGPVADLVGVSTALLYGGLLIVMTGPLVLLLPSVRGVRGAPDAANDTAPARMGTEARSAD